MHELHVESTDKAEIYKEILPQIECLIQDETDLIANLANIAAVLKAAFGWLWVGFYLVDAEKRELVLGPFQGPLACTRIPFGRGVCGQAWAREETIVVEDVNLHPDHIACSSLSQSEIVVPVRNRSGQLIAVLDADAETTACYDGTDEYYLNKLVEMIAANQA
ncbi:GAF domain-containing protein [Neisseria zoodegmatis]|nr:GAF domain-containing protein [Neisseria zoodegmatis]